MSTPPTAPTAMTYASLITSLKRYTEDVSATTLDELPSIVNRAERSIADKLKIMGLRTVFTGVMTASRPVITKPTGWRNTISINYGVSNSGNNRQTLRNRAYEYLRAVYPNDSILSPPVLYADYDQDHWIVGPTPDQAYPFEAIIYKLPDLLGNANQQNYLTQFVPNLLLYSCLTSLEPFLKNDSRLQVWQQLLADEYGSVTSQDMAKIIDRALRRTTS